MEQSSDDGTFAMVHMSGNHDIHLLSVQTHLFPHFLIS